jgi:hypothetical protein
MEKRLGDSMIMPGKPIAPIMTIVVVLAFVSIATACTSSTDDGAASPATTGSMSLSPSSSTIEIAPQGAEGPDPDPITTTATTTDSTIDVPATTTRTGGCEVGPVPASARLDVFYTQGCQVDGFWVVANEVVDPVAVTRAADTVERIFTTDDRLAPTLAADGIRLGIIGRSQRTTEMPEYRDLNEVFPETDWDSRARGLGATSERPLISAGEENVLCLPGDPYLGEDILLHEFSHVLHQFGYRAFDSDFDTELSAAFEATMDNGTWDGTYAATNPDEYWAEGVQSYLGRNLTAEPADGIHGPIDTRAELEAADPALFTLIDDRLNGLTLPPRCD